MSKKNIWIFSEYAGSPYHGMNYRHYYLSRELIKLGYKITIFTSAFSHHRLDFQVDSKSHFTFETIDGINYMWIKMPKYSGPKSFGRVRNWFLFAIKLFFLPWIKDIEKPDVIITSSLPLHPMLPAKILSKKYNAKLIFEVRDIWPLSAIELGGYSPKNPFIRHLQWLEDYAYKHADHVVTVLANAYEHMKSRGLEKSKLVYIPNGILLDEMQIQFPLDGNIVKKIPLGKFLVGYTGTLGIANALDSFIEAARLLKEDNSILFLIVGEGKEKKKLLDLAKDLTNVLFIDAIPKNQIQSMLNLLDVCYIGLRKDPLFKYGVSPNKLFDYMYAGKPILYAIDSGNYQPVSSIGAGVSVEAQNPKAISKAILDIKNLSLEARENMGKNAKQYVLKNHLYSILAKKFEEIF